MVVGEDDNLEHSDLLHTRIQVRHDGFHGLLGRGDLVDQVHSEVVDVLRGFGLPLLLALGSCLSLFMLVLEDSHCLSLVFERLDFGGTLDAFKFSLCEDATACWFA